MATTRNITVDDLWQLERLGVPSLSPDGAQAVAAVTRFSMDDNKSSSSLLLLSTLGGAARPLTQAGEKDGQPLWSPRGDRIAFVAKREQQGVKDDAPQLYLIAPDGGEAERTTTVATGIEGFRWFPDGKRIAFVSWVWPQLKGGKAQAKQAKEFKDRKETGYATSEAQYRFWDHHLPMGRVAHLHVMDLAGGEAKVRDLFEGTPYELTRADPGHDCFDISPDGRRIAFVFDPAAEKRVGNCFALAEMDVKSGRVEVIVQDTPGTWPRRATARTARTSRLSPATRASSTRCRRSWRCGNARRTPGTWSAANGTTRCTRRCSGKRTARRCSSWPNRRGATTSGASTCPTAAPRWWCMAATSAASTNAPARW